MRTAYYIQHALVSYSHLCRIKNRGIIKISCSNVLNTISNATNNEYATNRFFSNELCTFSAFDFVILILSF